MHLPHRRLQRTRLPAISLTKLAVRVPVWMLPAILHPEQRQRDPWLLQFLVELAPVGDDLGTGGRDRGSREQARVQRRIIEIVRERPLQARGPRALQIRGDGPE